jgi:DsbC/DsbD-like thiol-disulfide interchange protein
MKHVYFTLSLMCAGIMLHAQTGSAKQVKWEYSAKKIADNTWEVHMTANVGGKFHIYSQTPGAEGPIPTTFTFTPNPLLAMDGKPKEQGKKVQVFEAAWNGKVNYYEQKVDFVQVVKLKAKAKTTLNGKVEFNVCNDTMCLPPSEVEFKIPVGG